MPHEEYVTMTANEYVAQVLEHEAARMPSGYKAQADVLMEYAEWLKAAKDTKQVRVWAVCADSKHWGR